MSLFSPIRRYGRQLILGVQDTLSHHPTLREGAAWARYAAATIRKAPLAGLDAYQVFQHPGSIARLRRQVSRRRIDEISDILLEGRLSRYEEIYQAGPALTRCLVLKAPGAQGERGVLYIAFEYNLYRLLRSLPRNAPFFQQYDLLLSTSWSPTSYALLEWALRRIPGTLYLEASNDAEVAKLQAFHPRIQCVSTMPCQWIHPDNFAPRPHSARSRDVLMVANWAPFKRHFELFTALARMPASLKVTLIGQKEAGWTKQHIITTARELGARQELEVLESLPIHQVREIQCDSKVAVLMSRREGSCVAAMEALFANTPLGMRKDAHVGSRKYVNEATGRLLDPTKGMHRELAALLEAAPHLEPRQWAIDHLSCHHAIRRLNDELKQHSIGQGQRWTKDLAAMCWSPYPAYVRDEDSRELRPLYDALCREFPGVFTLNLIAPSPAPAAGPHAS